MKRVVRASPRAYVVQPLHTSSLTHVETATCALFCRGQQGDGCHHHLHFLIANPYGSATARHLGHSLSRPDLIGLSAGGFGALRVYTKSPEKFSRAIVMAAYPPADTLQQFSPAMSAYFVVGAREPYVQSGEFQRALNAIRPRIGKLEFNILPQADHYFLLAQRERAVDILQNWLR